MGLEMQRRIFKSRFSVDGIADGVRYTIYSVDASVCKVAMKLAAPAWYRACTFELLRHSCLIECLEATLLALVYPV